MEPEVITGRLRLAKPSQLRVFCTNRKDADMVAVSTKRDRWRRCVDVLAGMDWVRVDMLDAQGAIIETLSCHDADEPDGDNEQSELGEPESDEERWLHLMINAQRLALENHAHMLQPLIDGYVKLADVFGARLAALEKHFDRTLDVAYQNAILQAQVDAGPDADSEIVRQLIDKMGGKEPATKKLPAKKEGSGNGASQ